MANQYLKISEVIQPETVDLNLAGLEKKDDVINYLADLLFQAGHLSDKEEYIKSVYEREKLGPTYMGNFIAIPHGKSDAVIEAGVAFGRSVKGVQYDTELGSGIVKLIFLLAIPNRMSADAYMAVLARLARLLVHEEFCEDLYKANSYQDIYHAILRGEDLLEDLSNSKS